ncbi:MAG: aminoglycoside 6-adenylyltransferase [Provencibacterium sp.]|nr:aminoglycoside 6-adenylyltransferase [Provencibacterium sp.]
MRSEKQVIEQLLGFAREEDRIRLVGMAGSRTNENVPADIYRDYDISFLVTEMKSFLQSDRWLDRFGPRLMMQKPEAMELFPSELGSWFSYLILFEDGVKLDLTLIPLKELSSYLHEDRLLRILLDKDGLVPSLPAASDQNHWIKRPNARCFDDCCNEFWMTATYVAKGLLRGELPFAAWHMEQIVRAQLYTMLCWMIGFQNGFAFSLGKHHKFIRRYLTGSQWELLCATYRLDSIENGGQALKAAFSLFREASKKTAAALGCPYPDYDAAVTRYIEKMCRWKEEEPLPGGWQEKGESL